ncbi:hypothetical protein DLAC_00434 [Tieghemostelium lacteum]|uniref:Uncharacterized protein n=1 Tax=Tieghemostelium lacteum TaxID=361077 RepID=A0A152A9Z6_TIELA|nr:hypothetical protein DLAC_00434 [Tieghemostelium lacteum]|eukprot:KYR02951.1 hypothetical protein DLAC_00434 [Tieghemostelium lacteum]
MNNKQTTIPIVDTNSSKTDTNSSKRDTCSPKPETNSNSHSKGGYDTSGSQDKGTNSNCRGSKFVGTLVSQVVTGLVTLFDILSSSKKEANEKQIDRKLREATGKAPYTFHRSYSQCMADIHEFVKQHPKDYSTIFSNGMKTTGKRTEHFKRINDCRNLTKDYWRTIGDWCLQFPEYFENNKELVARYKKQHQQFTDLVQPLDNLAGKNPSEDDVYHIFQDDENNSSK